MCLAIPMRLVKVSGDEGVVESSGVRRGVNLSLVKNVKRGDYVLIHAGFAIERIHEKEARATLEAFRNIR